MKYQSGEEIIKGDCVLYHGEPMRIEFVASSLDDSETDWYVQEYGGGIMLLGGAFGRVFISADQIGGEENLEFVSRTDIRPKT
ncbi:MAG TPA: hypothetical protein VGR93_13785 [Candidatus Acidoferrales bacterium]|nr:hypothetical protein [Candidatus Acidoferrales bacterium]